MRKDSIINMIDKRIVESYNQGLSTDSIIKDIAIRVKNMSVVIKNEGLDIDELIKMDFDLLEKEEIKVRAKYSVFYIKHSTKRINDLKWLDSKKLNFWRYSSSQAFNLVKLKDKLSVENSVPIPHY